MPLLSTYAPPAADLDRLGRTALVIGGAGALATAGFAIAIPSRLFQSYLVAYVWVLGLALGSFGVMNIHHLSRGAWGLMIRRTLEAATRTIPLLALAFAPIALGMRTLYPWANPHGHGHA